VLDQTQLQHAMFPLGGYTKPEVRQMARKFGLPVANRRDSMDLCFLGKGDYRDFLRRNAPQTQNPGPIVDTAGNPLGEHQGLANYTIGQRKGLGIAAPQPYYVIAKDTRHNTLVVGGRAQMGQSELTARNVNWISGSPPSQEVRAHVMIRYKATPKLATVIPQEGDQAQVIFDEPLRDITPGQAAVFYQEDICLGGGIIAA
jgi:tRNA-specific 2-thiouridylase